MKPITDRGYFLKVCELTSTPVGKDFFETAIRENPDHFPEEYQRMKKWESIPKEVHDAYWRDWQVMQDELRKDEPKSDGVFGAMNNTEQSRIWSAWWNKMYPIERRREKELHDKHYSKYGI